MTIYLPNTVLHETGAEVDEFIDVSMPDPPPPTPPRGSPRAEGVTPAPSPVVPLDELCDESAARLTTPVSSDHDVCILAFQVDDPNDPTA